MKITDKKKNGKTYGVLLIHWKFVKSKNRHVSVQTMETFIFHRTIIILE